MSTRCLSMRLASTLPLFVLASACGGPAATPALGNSRGAAPQVARVTVPCPTGDALTALARTAWDNPAGTITARCVELFVGGQALWLVEGSVEHALGDDGEAVDLDRALVVAATGATLSKQLDTDQPTGVLDKMMGEGYTAVDLDGDGNDELIDITGWGHGGTQSLSLLVWRIDGNQLRAAGTLAMLDDNSAAVEDEAEIRTCRAEHKLVDGPDGGKRIELNATWAGGPDPTDCPLEGRHVYAWDGQGLVEVHD